GVTDPRDVAADKSLIAGLGPPWHKQDRQAGRAPKGVDRAAAWGYSKHDGWVHGYSYEVVVTATPQATVFPLLASGDVATARGGATFAARFDDLPAATRTVSADSGYDANDLAERVEYDARGRRTGRRFLCPENPRNNKRPQRKPGHADAQRARGRRRRQRRRQWLKGRRGRRGYGARGENGGTDNPMVKAGVRGCGSADGREAG